VHSWQKCAHTKLNTGSTAGPSGPAACIIRAIYATVPKKPLLEGLELYLR
jgi:hypothetical protein